MTQAALVSVAVYLNSYPLYTVRSVINCRLFHIRFHGFLFHSFTLSRFSHVIRKLSLVLLLLSEVFFSMKQFCITFFIEEYLKGYCLSLSDVDLFVLFALFFSFLFCYFLFKIFWREIICKHVHVHKTAPSFVLFDLQFKRLTHSSIPAEIKVCFLLTHWFLIGQEPSLFVGMEKWINTSFPECHRLQRKDRAFDLFTNNISLSKGLGFRQPGSANLWTHVEFVVRPPAVRLMLLPVTDRYTHILSVVFSSDI